MEQVGSVLQQAANLGGLALAAVGLFLLHREALKSHREEQEAQRKACHEDFESLKKLDRKRMKVLMRRIELVRREGAERYRILEVLLKRQGESRDE